VAAQNAALPAAVTRRQFSASPYVANICDAADLYAADPRAADLHATGT